MYALKKTTNKYVDTIQGKTVPTDNHHIKERVKKSMKKIWEKMLGLFSWRRLEAAVYQIPVLGQNRTGKALPIDLASCYTFCVGFPSGWAGHL